LTVSDFFSFALFLFITFLPIVWFVNTNHAKIFIFAIFIEKLKLYYTLIAPQLDKDPDIKIL